MPLKPKPLNTRVEGDDNSLLSPIAYDDDAVSLHSRSDQDTDSEDDEVVAAARNSRELRARDRLVLMEEEEMDKLVTDNRAKQDRQRRGSGLAIPNPLRMFKSHSLSPTGSQYSSVEVLPAREKRKNRRSRRSAKRERLMEQAEHGEDGQLMYEMESGKIKDGSSTGDSSDREDSDELDRQRLLMHADKKTEKRRKWKKWVFIHTIIAVGFAFLVLLVWKLSADKKRSATQLVSNGTALFAPTTLIISLDGFRADFLQRGLTPRLNAFVKEGVSPKYMLPSFPSVTFPNHYTLATGLYPESHGVVGNSFWDPKLQAEFYYTDPDRSMDAKWWGGEAFWITAENQGVRTAIHMWPGSEVPTDVEPSYVDKFNSKERLSNKVARILELLDKPGMEVPSSDTKNRRPQIIAAYVPNVDADGHKYGPNSTEIRTTISSVDSMLDQIFQGLEQRNLTNIVNVIIVSDHGMATTDVSRMFQIEDLIDMSKVDRLDGWPLVGVRPKNITDLPELHKQAAEKAKSNPAFDVYLRDQDMPERYHFSNNDRIAPLWIIPKTGWAIVTKEEFNIEEGKSKGLVFNPRGLHGYDHEHPLMRAIFIARGPAFPHVPNSKLDVFQNIEVYNILCDSVGMKPMPNNGTLRLPLKPVGLHDQDPVLEEPADPSHLTTTHSSTIAIASVATSNSPAETKTSSVADAVSSVGVDPVQDQPPAQTPSSEDETQAQEACSKFEKVADFMDCLRHKVDELWSKLFGSG